MSRDKAETIAYAIRKECQKDSLYDWCETWDITIDEAIEKESKIAKENQKIVDTQIVFDNVSISELYCDDTEVIEEHLSNYKKCAEYHKQIAEWLERLKAYECSDFTRNLQTLVYNQGYNKAIDDFVKFASDMPTVDEEDGTIRPMWLEEMAEKLKVGVNNEY